MKLWWGGASGRGRRAYGALTIAPRKNENKIPGRSHAPAGIQPPIKITRPVPFRLVQPVTGSYQMGNLSQSLISALIMQQFCRNNAVPQPSFLPHEHTSAARKPHRRIIFSPIIAAQMRSALHSCMIPRFAGSSLPVRHRLCGT